jgi:hypothetical protein
MVRMQSPSTKMATSTLPSYSGVEGTQMRQDWLREGCSLRLIGVDLRIRVGFFTKAVYTGSPDARKHAKRSPCPRVKSNLRSL